MAVTVRSIKHSFTDKSLTIPTAIISLMNADTLKTFEPMDLEESGSVVTLSINLRERLTSGVCRMAC